MSRLASIATVVFGGALVLSSSIAARGETLIVTTNVPPVHWASTQGGEPFMKCVKDVTKNGIDFNYFPSGQIAGFTQSLDAVNKGLAQISYIVVSAQTDKLPLNGIPLLPELGDTVVEMTNAYRKAVDAGGPIADEFTKNRIRPLLINMFPPYQMISRSEPLDSLERLSAKKISSGGGSLIVTLKSVGANAIEMAPTDIYLALQQGTIDGTMLALASVKPYKLQEVVKAMSMNGSFGSAAGIWSIDTGVWNKLPQAHQRALTDCGLKVEAELARWVDKLTEDLKAEFTASGIKMFQYTDDAKTTIAQRLKSAREEYISRIAARGLPAQKAYEDYLKVLGR